MKFREQSIIATVSVGVALAPADGNDPERLLKSADLAMYKAKADGRAPAVIRLNFNGVDAYRRFGFTSAS